MEVLATFAATEEERCLVVAALGPVAWPGGQDGTERVLLSMFPEGELREAALGWEDLPRLELVQLLTAGANHLSWARLPPHVKVATAPGATGPAIAEYVLGAVISWCRGFQWHTEALREGRFHMGVPVLALAGLRVGIIGHGGIGGNAARLLASLGCQVAAVARSPPTGRHLAWSGGMDALHRLASWCQVLVVALPHVRSTRGLVDKEVLARLPSPSLLVNVARGPVVDEDALRSWLEDPAHWAHLDVWWQYPRDRATWTVPFPGRNVTMTPHNSSNVPGHRLAMIEAAVENVRLFLAEGEARHVQDRSGYV